MTDDAQAKRAFLHRNEGRLGAILYKALTRGMDRMTELSMELARAFERDKAPLYMAATPEAAAYLDAIDVEAGAQIMRHLEELQARGIPPEVARGVLEDMAAHSQGWTRRETYRRIMELERDALRADLRQQSGRIIGQTAGEARLRAEYALQKSARIGYTVSDYPSEMVNAIMKNPHRSRWLLMAKKEAWGIEPRYGIPIEQAEVPNANGLVKTLENDGIHLRARRDAATGRRVLNEPINLDAVTKWLDTCARRTERNLYEICIEGIATGRGSELIARDLQEVRDTAAWRCRAMARTMVTETGAQTEAATMEVLGIEEYTFICGYDEKTCDVCGALDGHVFKLSEAKPGVNYPPMHPNCRCTTTTTDPDRVVINDGGDRVEVMTGQKSAYELEYSDKGLRRKYTRVPAAMTFEEWKKTHVKYK